MATEKSSGKTVKKATKKPAAKKPVKEKTLKKAVEEKAVKAASVKDAPKVTEEKITIPAKAEKKATGEKYFYAVGRRKASVAQVRVFECEKATESDMVINGKKIKEYFPTINHQSAFLAPLKAVGVSGNVKITVLVRGGGTTGQVEASRLGISRALVKMDETFKKTLKDMGYLTRDSRKVERKKPGLKKARRSPQWAKR